MGTFPKLRIAGFTDAWEQRKLGDISDSYSGGTPTAGKSEYYGGDIPFIRSAEVNSDSTELFLTEEGVKNSSAKMVNKGDILYALYGATSGEVGLARLNGAINQAILDIKPHANYDAQFIMQWLRKSKENIISTYLQGGQGNLSGTIVTSLMVDCPTYSEQQKIGDYFRNLDSLITLHQREPPKEDKILNDIKTDTLFHEYYCQWLVIYKEGSVRGVTMQKYHLTAEWVKKLIPDVKLCDFDRITYQQLINDYAETHERQTTMDFHHQLKGAILDAVDDGLIARDPTRKVIIKGKSPNDKKKKYLSRYELQKLLTSLDLNSGLNMDWLILLIAKTGMRFSEAIAVTPVDFDFTHQTLSVNKTWDYKGEGGFQPTKNKSSVRKIRLDWQTVGQFYAIVRELNDTAPIFVSKEKKIYNSTLNDVLERHCKAVGIPTISVHGLRHTHASLLLFDGVSIASVAQRLGHSSINTTQKTYLHIIRELENKDIDLIMKSISSLLD